MTADRARGFSLFEAVIVLMIGALIVTVGLYGLEQYLAQSRLVQAKSDVDEMSKAIRSTEKTTGVLPDTLASTSFASRLDPWGRPYQYFNLRTSTGNGVARKDKKLAPLNSDFDLYSLGPDGLSQASLANAVSRDDVVRARDGAFIGTAQEFDP